MGGGDGDGIDDKGEDEGGGGEDGGRGENARVEVVSPAFPRGIVTDWRGDGFSSSAIA